MLTQTTISSSFPLTVVGNVDTEHILVKVSRDTVINIDRKSISSPKIVCEICGAVVFDPNAGGAIMLCQHQAVGL